MARFLFGLIAGALVGVAGFVVITATRPPDLPPGSVTSGKPMAEIRVEQALLNEQLAAVASSLEPFSDVRAEVRAPGEIVLTGKYPIDAPIPITLYPRITLQVGAQAGRLTLYVSQIDVGNLNIPRAVVQGLIDGIEERAAGELNQWIARSMAGAQMTVRAVRVSDTYLIVELSR